MPTPALIKFINEELRPMAEILRKFKSRADEVLVTYDDFIAGELTGVPTATSQDRTAEGLQILTELDTTDMIAVLRLLHTGLDNAARETVISKHCVRASRE